MRKKNNCIDCNREIWKPSERCKSCATKYKHRIGILSPPDKGKDNPNWKGGKPKCSDCGIEVSNYGIEKCIKCSNKGKNNPMFGKTNEESPLYGKTRPEHSNRMKGSNNPNWRGGVSKLPYGFEFNKKLKDSILKRDNYTCQLCYKTNEEELITYNKSISIHHIDYDKQNCDIDNLISLCCKCNSKVNFDRNIWTNIFKIKVGESNGEFSNKG